MVHDIPRLSNNVVGTTSLSKVWMIISMVDVRIILMRWDFNVNFNFSTHALITSFFYAHSSFVQVSLMLISIIIVAPYSLPVFPCRSGLWISRKGEGKSAARENYNKTPTGLSGVCVYYFSSLLSFHHPSGLKVKTFSGTSSDEIWLRLQVD